jgi:hypothetical protein
VLTSYCRLYWAFPHRNLFFSLSITEQIGQMVAESSITRIKRSSCGSMRRITCVASPCRWVTFSLKQLNEHVHHGQRLEMTVIDYADLLLACTYSMKNGGNVKEVFARWAIAINEVRERETSMWTSSLNTITILMLLYPYLQHSCHQLFIQDLHHPTFCLYPCTLSVLSG